MTSVRAGRALLLVSASAAFMAGSVFLVNVPRYGAGGTVGGAILVVLSVGLAVAGFRRPAGSGLHGAAGVGFRHADAVGEASGRDRDPGSGGQRE